MRRKTEERRTAIMDVARKAFQELGFDGASMSEIASRLGGSKATLYNYFASKEELFLAIVKVDIDAKSGALVDILAGEPDFVAGLKRFAAEYLRLALEPQALSITRMVAAQPADSGLGKHFYENGLKQGWLRFAELLERCMAEGRLRQADPWLAAMHFKGMMDSDLVERRLINALGPKVPPATMRKVIDAGVDAFMRAYAP